MKDKLIGERPIYDEPLSSSDIAGKTFLDPDETAKLLNVSVRSLENMRAEGKGLPFYKFNRQVKYKVSDVKGYIEKRKVEVKDE